MQLNSRTLLERAALTNASCFESSLYILTEIKSQAACSAREETQSRSYGDVAIAHEGAWLVGVGGHLSTRVCHVSGALGSQDGLAKGCEPHRTPLLRA